jgi:ATP-binding cassette subfamily F protein 3
MYAIVYIFLFFRSGNLQIPSHISILHVEQEVVGDDTLSLDSVLESDEERHKLLTREKELNQLLNSR